MGVSLTFWSPVVWTLLGALFTIVSLALTLYIAVVGRDIYAQRLEEIVEAVERTDRRSANLRLGNPEAAQRNVGALPQALAPHGRSVAQTLRDGFRGLTIDLRTLTAATHETRDAVTRLVTVAGASAPLLPEILAELRRLRRGDLKIQRRLPPFSLFDFFGKARAAALARERIQATPSPFHELD